MCMCVCVCVVCVCVCVYVCMCVCVVERGGGEIFASVASLLGLVQDRGVLVTIVTTTALAL